MKSVSDMCFPNLPRSSTNPFCRQRTAISLSLAKPKFAYRERQAAIKFGEGDFFSSGDGIRVTFEILGGVDFPRLIISLRIPEHGASMHAVFRPWHPNFRSFPNPTVHLNNLNSVGELLGRFFGFSERMHSLTVQVDSPELWLRTALGLTGT